MSVITLSGKDIVHKTGDAIASFLLLPAHITIF